MKLSKRRESLWQEGSFFVEGSGCSRPVQSEEGKDIQNQSKHSTLSIIYTNAQSIVNKMDELRVVALSLNPEIILISES